MVVEGAEMTVEGAEMTVEDAEMVVEGAGMVVEGAEMAVEGAGMVVEGGGIKVKGEVGVGGGYGRTSRVPSTPSPSKFPLLLHEPPIHLLLRHRLRAEPRRLYRLVQFAQRRQRLLHNRDHLVGVGWGAA